MKEKALSVLLVAAMTAGMLAGCGGKSEGKGADAGGEEGKVINIYSWNDEFRQRVEAVYPEVEKTSDDGTVTTLKDGTEIHWIVNPNQDGVYQQKLDEALMKQADAAEDEKIDIFLSETDYVNKYTDAEADAAIPLKDLGIDPDKDLADQYDFTKVTASDAEGVQRGSTWQCCPGLLVYRRDIAKEVFGTDDPVIIGEKTNNWDTLKTTAGELAAKGYFTFASYADTFRLYGNSIAQPWVANSETTIKVDEQIVNWIKDSKEWLDAQYFNKTVKGQWNDDWNKTMGSESKVFAFSGVTTKHFACNNQEDNRMGVDACVSERALREIYFRGFEIAVKKSAPVSIMTSYNLINGVHAANSRDLCTVVVREEWGFEGTIMSDWNTTVPEDGSEPWKCAAAGNDIIMPGNTNDDADIRDAYEKGLHSEREIRSCAGRIIAMIDKLAK